MHHGIKNCAIAEKIVLQARVAKNLMVSWGLVAAIGEGAASEIGGAQATPRTAQSRRSSDDLMPHRSFRIAAIRASRSIFKWAMTQSRILLSLVDTDQATAVTPMRALLFGKSGEFRCYATPTY